MDIHQILPHIKFYAPLFSAVVISIFLGIISHLFLYKTVNKHYPSPPDNLAAIFFRHMSGPFYVIFPLFYITIASYFLDFSNTSYIVSLIVKIFLTIAIAWSVLKLIDYSHTSLLHKYQQSNNAPTSSLITKAYLLKKFAKIFVTLFALSILLLNFDSVRELGKGIIVSASVLGAVAIFAAQKLFSNLISGFQLAFTKPIQIGDTVKVGDELGTIEEITLTYITIRTWDQRKLVAPLSHLMEKPFENWTQLNNGILGTVFFYTDYGTNMGQLRMVFKEILEANSLWDKRIAKLEVTNLTEKTMEIRALISAKNSDDLWNLRCQLREKMLAFIYEQTPQNLPKERYADTSMEKDA